MSTILVDNLTGKTSAGSITVTSEGGAATQSLQQGLAKQWARVAQNSTPQSIEDSLNVSSVNDGGAGQTRFNFTNVMNNDLYSNLGIAGSSNRFCISTGSTTDGAKIIVYSVSGQSINDSTHVFNNVNGDLA